MRILTRAIFREVASAAFLGTVLFAFVLFLQKLGSGKYFEVLLRGSATPKMAAYLFALVLPPVLSFAIPIGTLVGVLIGLGRMSGDGEITAMRAGGVPARRAAVPVLAFATLMMAIAAAATLHFTPLSIRETYRVLNSLIAKQLSAEIQPRVFEEQFTRSNTVLYVGDVVALPGTVAKWRNVFIADLTPPSEQPGGTRDFGDAPGSRIETCPWDRLDDAAAGADLIVNTTSLGMVGQPPLRLDLGRVSDRTVVADAVYVPLTTPLLAAAKARGLRTVDGLGMLLHQAVPGFARWFGIVPRVTEDLRALVEADIGKVR